MSLLVELTRSALIGELRFDAEVEEIAEILHYLLEDDRYEFSPEFPYTKAQMMEVEEVGNE